MLNTYIPVVYCLRYKYSMHSTLPVLHVSQISFQLRRRLADNMARSFANHFARRTVYIGSRIPSQHHCRRVFVDRNEIHFDSAEHNVLDEEPLNSAEYAQRSEPFRSDRGLGERREYAYA